MEITNLARDIAYSLSKDGHALAIEDVQRVLDEVETLGGFDLTDYESADDGEVPDLWDNDDDDDND